MDFEKLKAPFHPSLISWRVGATNGDKTSGIALAYIDARDVMDRLDDVCGVDGWQVKYSHANGKTIADIGIKVGDEWIWKASGAGDTQVEAEKGAISDALKRAAVVWGIGRYLYNVENLWVDLAKSGRSYKIKNPNDSRLTGALEKAANGVRVYGEEPKKEEVKKPEAVVKAENLVRDIRKMTDTQAITKHVKDNPVTGLNEKQVEWLDKEIKKHLSTLEEVAE